MLAMINTGTLTGVSVDKVVVESDLSFNIPNLLIVGLPDTTVKESKDRIKAAIVNSSFEFPLKRITVNLAPADARKEGSHFDLPIALSILVAELGIEHPLIGKSVFLGELSLNGNIYGNDNILALVIGLKEKGWKNFFIPKNSLKQLKVIAGITFYPVESLRQLVEFLCGQIDIETKSFEIDQVLLNSSKGDLDFKDVMGQESAKRALTISAAGNHNIAMIGTPGAGKSMLAKRLPAIMPNMTYEERLETTKIYSIAGELSKIGNIVFERPFRMPHHSSSYAALLGGGNKIKPGEISLAHNGVLFLDELTEFTRHVLDNLREPMESGEILLSRANSKNKYPSDFLLIAAMNPCPCGYYGHPKKACVCSETIRKKYFARISGPLLDRIDLKISVEPVEYKDLSKVKEGKPTKVLKEAVIDAVSIQRSRYKEYDFASNSKLPDNKIREFCALDYESEEVLEIAFNKYSFSARSVNRILKVSRTIADLEKCDNIQKEHLLEALSYRMF